MISKLIKEQILTDLIGLGITFSGKRPNFKKEPVTPEQAIVNALPFAKIDFLVMQLLHTWVMENHELIHAELLSKVASKIENRVESAILGGLLTYTKDKRFKTLTSKISRIKPEQNSEIEKSLSLSARVGQHPYDNVMSKFGVKMTELETEKSATKFLSRDAMAKMNPFIKCRLLFGSNARADVAALMTLGFNNPSEVKRILNFSYETAHRNTGSLKEAGWPFGLYSPK